MPDHFFVYPEYLLRGSSRALGRRVPSDLALAEVNLDQIVAAARALGYKVEPEPGKQYPRQEYRFAGRARVTKNGRESKAAFLRRLAEQLKKTTDAERDH